MSDRPNWYSETGPERRGRWKARWRSLRIWVAVAAVALLALAWGGGPFDRGMRCTTTEQLDASTGLATVDVDCHRDRGWLP